VLDQRSELLDAPEVELLVEDFVDQAHHAALLKEPDLHRLKKLPELVEIPPEIGLRHAQHRLRNIHFAVKDFDLHSITEHDERGKFDVRFCEGFRMPADDGRLGALRGLGPAFENVQRRKSREAMRRRCGVLYGDLATGRGVADGSRRVRADGAMRLRCERGLFR
jgi:hypothetical protein